MKLASLCGSNRDLRDRRDFFQTETPLIAQLHRQALIERQLPQTSRQPIMRFHLLHWVSRLLGCIFEWHVGGLSPLTTKRSQRLAVSDAEDPARDSRSMTKLAGALPDSHERVVNYLFSIFMAPVHPRDEVSQAPAILHIELLKCLAVAHGNARYQVT